MSRGARFRNALTDRRIKALKPGEKSQNIADGGGLYLKIGAVSKGGGKSWVVRVTVRDKTKPAGQLVQCGLGSVRDLPLAEAREWAQTFRTVALEGRDPRTVKIERDRDGRLRVADWHPAVPLRQGARNNPTFSEAFDQFFEFRSAKLTSEKFARQWRRDVERFAEPVFGDRRVASITSADIVTVLEPIWFSKSDTAGKVFQRLAAFFDYAMSKGWHSGPNPASVAKSGLGRQPERSERRASLHWTLAPSFYQQISSLPASESTRLALRTVILTASRSIEVRLAEWNEIDMDARVWMRPASHMKTREAHAVPITDELAAVFEAAAVLFGREGLLFPGLKGKALSENTLIMPLKRIEMNKKASVHGFRSTFRSWAQDRRHDFHACELQLAHRVGSEVVRAYARSDLMDIRREVMEAWEAFLLD